jgi:hypothetical protein
MTAMDELESWRNGKLSSSQVARELVKQWRQQVGSEAPEPTALATRLAELRRSKNLNWWVERPKALALVARQLKCGPEELIDRTVLEPGALAFAEFPRLPPLAVGEIPCRLSRYGSIVEYVLGRISTEATRALWVFARPGAGKSLAIRWLQAAAADSVVARSVSSLEEAAALAATDSPLVIELEDWRPREGAAALRVLGRRAAATLVLAPFALPESPWRKSHYNADHEWERWDDELPASWREQLIAWVEHRLKTGGLKTRLIKRDVSEWLRRHDPQRRHVSSPGDLLCLCADFDVYGPETTTLSGRARRWVSARVPAALPHELPQLWRERLSAQAYEEIVRGHFMRLDERLGSLTAERWEEFLPARFTTAKSGPVGARALIESFQQVGLLRRGPDGLVSCPVWVGNGLQMHEVAKEMDGSSFRWGLQAADETRSPIVDAALDAMTNGALTKLVQRAAARADASELSAVSAVEAILTAVARRFADLRFVPSESMKVHLHELLSLQLEVLVDRDGRGLPYPVTRSAEEWLATAWTLSLRLPAPPGLVGAESSWVLPGWAPHLSLAEGVLSQLPLGGWQDRSWAGERILALTPEVLQLLKPQPIPPELPALLVMGIFLSASRGVWELRAEHLQALANAGASARLAELAKSLPPAQRQELGELLWRLVANLVSADGRVPVAERLERLRVSHGELLPIVCESLAPEVVANTARRDGIHRRRVDGGYVPSDPQALLQLTEEARQAALIAWLEGAPERGARFDEARELVPLLAAGDLDVALRLVRAGDPEIAAEFVSFVWSTAPERGRQEALAALTAQLPAAKGWFILAPRWELPKLADHLRSQQPRPDWASDWALWRIRDAGEAAEVLYALSRESAARRRSGGS